MMSSSRWWVHEGLGLDLTIELLSALAIGVGLDMGIGIRFIASKGRCGFFRCFWNIWLVP